MKSGRYQPYYRGFTEDHIIALEPGRFGLLQWLTSWATMCAGVDHNVISKLLSPMDLVVRCCSSNEAVYRTGPFFGDEAEEAAAKAHLTIQLLGLDGFLNEPVRPSGVLPGLLSS